MQIKPPIKRPDKYRLKSYESLKRLEKYRPLLNWWQTLDLAAAIERLTHTVEKPQTIVEPDWPSEADNHLFRD